MSGYKKPANNPLQNTPSRSERHQQERTNNFELVWRIVGHTKNRETNRGHQFYWLVTGEEYKKDRALDRREKGPDNH